MECRVCGGATVPAVVAPERMHGMGGAFAYDACGVCGAVQLREVPEDLARYYPDAYYAHQPPASKGRARRVARRIRNHFLYRNPLRVGWLANPLAAYEYRQSRRWFAHARMDRDARILDVGCGRGALLEDLAEVGYRRLVGVDPFIAAPVTYGGGAARVERATIFDLPRDERFALIMFHHSLEHMAEQRAVMARAAELLEPGGWCLVRVPIVSSWAWEHYGADWVQLDPPRHLVLHSRESLRRLGESCGLELERVECDSTEFQFIGSEGYRLGLTLFEAMETFPPATIREWRRRAYRLNRQGRGDQAAFYFRRPS